MFWCVFYCCCFFVVVFFLFFVFLFVFFFFCFFFFVVCFLFCFFVVVVVVVVVLLLLFFFSLSLSLFKTQIMKSHRFFMSLNFLSQILYYRRYRFFMISFCMKSVTDSL